MNYPCDWCGDSASRLRLNRGDVLCDWCFEVVRGERRTPAKFDHLTEAIDSARTLQSSGEATKESPVTIGFVVLESKQPIADTLGWFLLRSGDETPDGFKPTIIFPE